MIEELERPLIGIDLGASYTKIGYREAGTNSNEFDKNTGIVSIEGDFMIPSMAVQIAKKSGAWLFGREAAEYVPVGKDKIYTNWKKGLFSSSFDSKVAECVSAADHFFAWLRERLLAEGIDASTCNARVCMPAFSEISRPAKILAEAMARNGWSGPRISHASEPNANSIGIFTEGRNRLWKQSGGSFEPVLANIYESSSIFDTFRRQAITGKFRSFSVAILDVGSFTTDVQILTYCVDAEPDFVRRTFQESHAIGVLDDFEKPLFTAIHSYRPFPLAETSLTDRERMKAVVCNGGKHVFAAKSGSYVFDYDKFGAVANEVARDFADKAWRAVSPAIKRNLARKVVLTGGGAEARPIRESLSQNIECAGHSVMTLPADSQWKYGISRLATALGAGSVLFEFPKAAARAGSPTTYTPARSHECRCRGGNKDCMFCSGSGFYKPS
jgi:hypothetical protein